MLLGAHLLWLMQICVKLIRPRDLWSHIANFERGIKLADFPCGSSTFLDPQERGLPTT